MGKQIKTREIADVTVTDDFDGGELPTDTKPLTVRLEDTEYTLYLSEANKAEVQSVLKKIRTRGETTKPQRVNRTVDFGHEPTTVREWAVEKGLIKGPGRISQLVYVAYDMDKNGKDWKALTGLKGAKLKAAIADYINQQKK